MTDYSKMSDFEVNRAVGEILLNGRWSCKPGTGGNDTESWYYGSVDTFVTPYAELPDYCNSWADAGPIISSRNITIINSPGQIPFATTDYYAMAYEDYESCLLYSHPNVLRAAMIVFLMMNEGE